MANSSLIHGAANLNPGIRTQDIKSALDGNRKRAAYDARAKDEEVRAAKARVSANINKMKGNVDTTGLSENQQALVKEKVLEVKKEYIAAANEIGQVDKGSDRWIELKDIMDSANTTFSNMDKDLGAYKTNAADFLSDVEGDLLSGGDPDVLINATNVYDQDAPFQFGKNGSLLVSGQDGVFSSYKDFKHPTDKAYPQAKQIMKWAGTLNSAGQEMGVIQQSSMSMQLNEMFMKNPSSMNSLIADRLIAPDVLDIDPSFYAGASQIEKREMLVEKIMESLKTVANNSIKVKKVKDEEATTTTPNSPTKLDAPEELPKGQPYYEGEFNEKTGQYKVIPNDNGSFMSAFKTDKYGRRLESPSSTKYDAPEGLKDSQDHYEGEYNEKTGQYKVMIMPDGSYSSAFLVDKYGRRIK